MLSDKLQFVVRLGMKRLRQTEVWQLSLEALQAHLGLARALALTGDASAACQAYRGCFAGWKDADADLPVMIEARKEVTNLP